MDACTIIAKNYLAHARVLAESFREHRPEDRFFVLVIDGLGGRFDPGQEPFEVLEPADLGIETFDRMAALYGVLELSTAVKPWLMRHLLYERGAERLVYLDPDIRLYDDLEEIHALLGEHTAVVTPHLTAPMPRDGASPSETDILGSGSFNLGFIGLSDGPETHELLDWWSERLETDCVVAPASGFFVDQRWMDFAPGLVERFHVLRDPGYNVAYWNLPSRELTRTGGGYEVNGRPLRFFHFSAYEPDHPGRLSKHQDRVELTPGSALAGICEDYGEQLLAKGYRETIRWPYGWAELPNGVALDPALRQTYREAVKAGALPRSAFTDEGARELMEWADGPAGEGAAAGVTRYLHALHGTREDLRAAYPDLAGRDGARLVAWAQTDGRGHMPPELVPGRAGDPLVPGVNVAGYFRSVLGIGEHARLVVSALEEVGVPVAPVGLVAHGTSQEERFDHRGPAGAPYPLNLVSVNADVLPDFAQHMGHGFFAGRYTIGLWAWEVFPFPARYEGAFDHVDEVWVLSEHVARALAQSAPVPVLNVRLPISVPPFEPRSRAELVLPEGLLFLFVFDHDSVFERKNPLALVEAFTRAFEPGAGPSLVVKTINGDRHPEAHAALERAAAGHPDVHVIDRVLPRADKDAMIAACDCYVSLHRAEGFGITLAEAMYLGKPVIATGFSGNLDYMTRQNSFLVDHAMVPIGEGNDPYPPEGEWAEPDIDHAARLMRRVADDPEAARERGGRAAADIRATHSMREAGLIMSRRLARARTRSGVRRARMLDTAPVERLVASGPVQGAPPTRAAGMKRSLREAMLRFIKPYTMHQQRVDNGLITQIRTLETAVRSLAESQAQLERLAAEARAVPDRPGGGAQLREHPVAGVVSGYGPGDDGPVWRSGAAEGSDRARLLPYVELLRGHEPVLDLAGADTGLAEMLREAGVAVEAADGGDPLARLEDAEEESLGALFVSGPAERLEHDDLERLVQRAAKVLLPAGVLVIEAVNPHSVAAMKTFAADPRRRRPLFPEVALELARAAGYGSAFVFHPGGSGNVEADRFHERAYALVATLEQGG